MLNFKIIISFEYMCISAAHHLLDKDYSILDRGKPCIIVFTFIVISPLSQLIKYKLRLLIFYDVPFHTVMSEKLR